MAQNTENQIIFHHFQKVSETGFRKKTYLTCQTILQRLKLKTTFFFRGLFVKSFGNQTLGCLFQELREANPAAERHQDPSEELRCLPQAQELAVVETLHQSQASAPGRSSI